MRPSQQFTQHTHHTNNPLKWASHRCAIRQYHQVNKHTTTKNCITKKEDTRVHYTVLTQHKQHTLWPHTVTMPCTIFHGDIMLQTPNRRNKPSPKHTLTVCAHNFSNPTNYPPQGSHQTLTPPTTTRAGVAQLNVSIYMGCAFLPTNHHY